MRINKLVVLRMNEDVQWINDTCNKRFYTRFAMAGVIKFKTLNNVHWNHKNDSLK